MSLLTLCISASVFTKFDTHSLSLTLLAADGLAKKFGLTPEQFGENLRDSYQRHETEQFPAEPIELAKDYVCSQFSSPEAVLEGTRYMVAMQIAREPLVRHVLRQTFQERAKVNIKPTKKGKKVRSRPIVPSVSVFLVLLLNSVLLLPAGGGRGAFCLFLQVCEEQAGERA